MRIGLGCLALGMYALHAAHCVLRGHGAEMLWACHVAVAAIGVGLLCQLPTCVAAGCFCLTVGTPLWLFEVLLGREVLFTSYLTHLGGLSLGWLALHRVGVPAGSWWKAVLGLAILQRLCWCTTPAAENVNAAFAVFDRFQPFFPNYFAYLLVSLGTAGLLFYLLERLGRFLLAERLA